MINITLVSYINTRPFIDGFLEEFSESEIKLNLVPPSECATDLLEGKCDLALVPIGAISDFEEITILPNYCLGAHGKVESVFLLSHVPVQELETVILDRHSRTSNGLVKVLLKHFWKKEVTFTHPTGAHFDQIKGTHGGVVIGDKAIKIKDQFPYAYDLSEAWTEMTALPFTFAVWAHRGNNIDKHLKARLDRAMEKGVAQVRQSATRWSDYYGIDLDFAIRYLEEDMDYLFDAQKHKAMRLYLRLLKAIEASPPGPKGVKKKRKEVKNY